MNARRLRSLRRPVRRAADEVGAVVIEFALVFPLLVVLTFGIMEGSSAYHDSSITADASRAGGRVASAQARNPGFAANVVTAVDAALTTLPADAPQELWIYKANSNGFPGASNNFSSCASNCIRYTWDDSARQFTNPQGTWPASTHEVCNEPFDQIGVYVKVDHAFVTKLFGARVTLTDHTVFRFEPAPTSACT